MKDPSELSVLFLNNLDIPLNRYDTSEIKQRYTYFNRIKLKGLVVTILTGTDHADLLLHIEFRVERERKPLAVSTKLGWVLMGGSKRNKREDSCNFLCGNCSSAIDQNVQNFWSLELYETLPKLPTELLPPDEKKSLSILEETTVIKENRFDKGLLWESAAPHLPANRKMTIKKSKNHQKESSRKIQTLRKTIMIKLKSV